MSSVSPVVFGGGCDGCCGGIDEEIGGLTIVILSDWLLVKNDRKNLLENGYSGLLWWFGVFVEVCYDG